MKDITDNVINNLRPLPFWSWNDRLEAAELRNQVKEMKKAGLGGYFMHARSGLKTEYLSEDWFDKISAGLSEGKAQNLEVWLYDEEGWPSGFGGGLVPAISESFQAAFITFEACSAENPLRSEGLLAAYVAKNDGYSLVKAAEVATSAVYLHRNSFYIDTMNKSAVEAFIQVTHEEYYRRFAPDFGHSLKGFFTDEPRLACDHFGEIPWSSSLPSAFLEKYGYDILEILPDLFINGGKFQKSRYQFWTLINQLFAENYMKTLYDWCADHNCSLTGHIMMEESIFSQMTSSGGVMPLYEYFQIPGIDWLRRRIDSPLVPKQVSSVAEQLGKEQVLTESYALCGWDVSFEEIKWIAEWQYVHGVNRLCQHLEAYTLRGSRKRDYPPSLFIQQSWWEEYSIFNDYIARLGAFLSLGEVSIDVLLLHPLRSGYVFYNGTRTEEIRELDRAFEGVLVALSKAQMSYHLGDDSIIAKYGQVKGARFQVGKIAYRAVVLPPMEVIAAETLDLLSAFAENGGAIYALGRLPSYTDGNKEALIYLLTQVKTVSIPALKGLLLDQGESGLQVVNDQGEESCIFHQWRKTPEEDYLFLVNLDKENDFSAIITLKAGTKSPIIYSLESGTEIPMEFMRTGESIEFRLYFHSMQSYCLILREIIPTVQRPMPFLRHICKPKSQWKIDHKVENSLTLDTCSYKIDEGSWQDPIAVIHLQKKLLDLRRACQVEMEFRFFLDMEPSQCEWLYAVIEDASLYDITLNGREITTGAQGYWKDKSFHRVNILPGLQKGENRLRLKTHFQQSEKVYEVLYGENVYETEKNKLTYDIELESIYLLGDFGVFSQSDYEELDRKAKRTRGGFILRKQPTSLISGDFTTQGFCFFAGELEISQELEWMGDSEERVILDLSNLCAPLASLSVNGQVAGKLVWAPYELDITPYLKKGKNTLSLTLFASNRNLFGPHHHIRGECYNVGPDSFSGKWSWVERESEADATEIFDRSQNFWTDSYCFVAWGI